MRKVGGERGRENFYHAPGPIKRQSQDLVIGRTWGKKKWSFVIFGRRCIGGLRFFFNSLWSRKRNIISEVFEIWIFILSILIKVFWVFWKKLRFWSTLFRIIWLPIFKIFQDSNFKITRSWIFIHSYKFLFWEFFKTWIFKILNKVFKNLQNN